jgi:hypothetical protein
MTIATRCPLLRGGGKLADASVLKRLLRAPGGAACYEVVYSRLAL